MSVAFYTLPPLLGGLKTDYPKEQLSDDNATIANNVIVNGKKVIQSDFKYGRQTLTGGGTYAKIRAFDLESGDTAILGTSTSLTRQDRDATVTNLITGKTAAKWFMFQWRQRMFISLFDAAGPVSGQFYSYDYTTLTSTPYTVNGSTNYSVSFCVSHKSRMYLVLKEDATGEIDCWYSDVNSISGALTVFDVSGGSGGLFLRGGFLLAIGTLSRMSPAGDQSQFVLISNLGECLVYNGANPSSSDWVLVRRISIPKPLSLKRYTSAVISANSDVYVLTTSGVISINKILAGEPSGEISPIGQSIKAAWSAQTAQQGANNHYTHDLMFDSKRGIVVAAIPGTPSQTALGGAWLTDVATGSSSKWNYPIETITQISTLFEGFSFETISNGVHYWWSSLDDFIARGGTSEWAAEDWEIGSAWSTLGQPHTRKSIKALRIRLQSNSGRDIIVTVYVDSDYRTSSNGYTYTRTNTGVSDVWLPVQASGENFRIRIVGAENSAIEIGSIGIKFETGSGVI